MIYGRYGKYHDENAVWKHSTKDSQQRHRNSVTRRGRQISENLRARQPSTSLVSAGLKSLRLYRHICRMIPYIIKIHEITHRTTPEQAKIFVGNHFRANAHMTDLSDIDFKVDVGYELLHDAEWHYSQTGYLYKYLMPPSGVIRDHGIDHFQERRAEKATTQNPSKFLKSFYKGNKSFEI